MIDIQAVVTGVSVSVTGALILDKIFRSRKRDEDVAHVIRKTKRCDPEQMEVDITELKEDMGDIKKHVDRSFQTENEMLMNDLAILDGLRQLKCNGKVSERWEKMQQYLIERR